MTFYTQYPSPLGDLLLISNGEALTGLLPAGLPREEMLQKDDLPLFAQVRCWLDAYFRGLAPDPFALPLSPAGTPFQQLVWDLLLQIPWGQTRTYGQLAQEIARLTGKATMSPQAVGGAVGRNPIAIIIPCHRILGAHGELTGYACGLDKKVWLLQQEGCHFQGI